MKRPKIIAFGSGKGGVGKTTLLANIAIILSDQDLRVIAMDLDYLGPNLHTALGMPAISPNLTSYLAPPYRPLDELLAATKYPNLQIIPGDGENIEMGKLINRKRKNIWQDLQHLDADLVLLDLTTGMSSTTVYFCERSDLQIALATPELFALENLRSFLRALCLQKIKTGLDRYSRKEQITLPGGPAPLLAHPAAMVNFFQQIDPVLGKTAQKALSELQIRLIINRLQMADQLTMVAKLPELYQQQCGPQISSYGTLEEDRNLWRLDYYRQPIVDLLPNCNLVYALREITQHLITDLKVEKKSNLAKAS